MAATPVFVEHVETMKGLAVAPLAEPRFDGLALRILNKGISWRHDISREHLLYSERELESGRPHADLRESKVAREREKKRREREPRRTRRPPRSSASAEGAATAVTRLPSSCHGRRRATREGGLRARARCGAADDGGSPPARRSARDRSERVLAGGAGDDRLHDRGLAAHRPEAAAPRVSHHRHPSVRLSRRRATTAASTSRRGCNALRELGGDALLVPESPALGGFGYEIGGRLFNVDTLKFYEVLIGMERGGVLAAVRERERPVVCEIGAGWGGFAYQFKTLFPRSTYVIVDFPELFLFSATYLGDGVSRRAAGVRRRRRVAWPMRGDADFVFVPHTLAGRDTIGSPDLLVNMVSFQEMTDAQVRGYAAMAAAAGCPLHLQLQSRALAVQHRAGQRQRGAGRAVSAHRSAGARHGLHERDEEAAEGGQAGRALGVRLPSSGRAARSGRRARPWRDVAAAGADRRRRDPRTRTRRSRVVLGMTLYNNAAHLPEAIESLLAQTDRDFVLVLLDDASSDATESIAREYAARDPRVTLPPSRIPPGDDRDLARRRRDRGARACRRPSTSPGSAITIAGIRAGSSGCVAELDGDPDAVLAYPITRRIGQTGVELDKGPRLFDTTGCARSARALAAHVPRRRRRRRHGVRPDAARARSPRPASSVACCGRIGCSSPS